MISGCDWHFVCARPNLFKAARRIENYCRRWGTATDQYDLTVVRPVAKEIARQIKITGFMNHTTNTQMAHFKSAVRTILFELTQRGVNLNFAEMDPPVRDGLINEIARQTRRVVLSERGCCQGLVSFFKAQATPKQIEDAAL